MGEASAATADPVARAHEQLLQDRSLQFAFDGPPPPPRPPSWLLDALATLGRWLGGAGPAAAWGLYILVGLLVLLLLAVIVRELIVAAKAPRAPPADLKGAEGWRPGAARARALLEEADRLAAEGRYADAAHLLLHRSIQDIDGRRPDLIGPSLTSRDIGALPELPPGPRGAFLEIAAAVERGIFAGRPLLQGDWSACRGAYVRFAFPDGWAGAG